jgi:hypothetical protein
VPAVKSNLHPIKKIVDMLKLTVIGYLGADAKVKEHDGKIAINFPIAHNEKYKDKLGIIRYPLSTPGVYRKTSIGK